MYFIRKKITSFFRSRKLAVILILLIMVLSVIGIQIPQKSQLKSEVYDAWKNSNPEQAEFFEKIGFTNLFSSFIFLTAAFLLTVNTLFCTQNMLNAAIRKLKKNPQFQKREYITGLENKATLRTEKENSRTMSEINSVLKTRGYEVSNQENRIFAHKNRFGVLGTPLFHVCILVIIFAAVYGNTGRMEGDMRLIEGQTLSEHHGNYMFINEGPFFHENHRGFNITLESFDASYNDETGTLRGGAGRLVITENGQKVKTDTVYSNHMMTYDGYTFLGNVYGLAPLLILTNPDGTVYSGSYVTASDPDGSGRYVARFDIGDTGLEGEMMVYMTANLISGEITESDIEQMPVLFLKIFDKGEEIYDGRLRLNDTVNIYDRQLGIDRSLGFFDIKYWSNFYVVRDAGTIFVYAGIGMIILSLTMTFFFVPRKVWVEVINGEESGSEIFMGGRADKFRFLYEEDFSSMVNEIKERINGTD
jgi:cytochrome c biogenesis protein ResB